MARAGAFVLSSAYEGLPNVLIQAMALGTPVVSTDCPSGPDEILDGGRLGALVAVGDAAAMADAIVTALGSAAASSRRPEWSERYRRTRWRDDTSRCWERRHDGRHVCAGSSGRRPTAGAEPPGHARPSLRVLLVSTSMSGGGAERQVYLLARGLRRRGHTVAVVSMIDPERYVTELAARASS